MRTIEPTDWLQKVYDRFIERGYTKADAQRLRARLWEAVCDEDRLSEWQVDQILAGASEPELFLDLRKTPEGVDYWLKARENVRWVQYERETKWDVIPAKNELAWGQPVFTVVPSLNELSGVKGGSLLISQREQEMVDLVTGETSRHHWQTFAWLVPYTSGAVFELRAISRSEVRAWANWFDERLPSSFYEQYANILVERK